MQFVIRTRDWENGDKAAFSKIEFNSFNIFKPTNHSISTAIDFRDSELDLNAKISKASGSRFLRKCITELEKPRFQTLNFNRDLVEDIAYAQLQHKICKMQYLMNMTQITLGVIGVIPAVCGVVGYIVDKTRVPLFNFPDHSIGKRFIACFIVGSALMYNGWNKFVHYDTSLSPWKYRRLLKSFDDLDQVTDAEKYSAKLASNVSELQIQEQNFHNKFTTFSKAAVLLGYRSFLNHVWKTQEIRFVYFTYVMNE